MIDPCHAPQVIGAEEPESFAKCSRVGRSHSPGPDGDSNLRTLTPTTATECDASDARSELSVECLKTVQTPGDLVPLRVRARTGVTSMQWHTTVQRFLQYVEIEDAANLAAIDCMLKNLNCGTHEAVLFRQRRVQNADGDGFEAQDIPEESKRVLIAFVPDGTESGITVLQESEASKAVTLRIAFGGTLRTSGYVNFVLGRKGMSFQTIDVSVEDGRVQGCLSDSGMWLPEFILRMFAAPIKLAPSAGNDEGVVSHFTMLLAAHLIKDVRTFYNMMQLAPEDEPPSRQDLQQHPYLRLSNVMRLTLQGFVGALTHPTASADLTLEANAPMMDDAFCSLLSDSALEVEDVLAF